MKITDTIYSRMNFDDRDMKIANLGHSEHQWQTSMQQQSGTVSATELIAAMSKEEKEELLKSLLGL